MSVMTNLELQQDILKNLFLGLQKQSLYYVTKINEVESPYEQRKEFEKELSDISKVLTELSSNELSYTVQELDTLRIQFNDRLIQLNSIITNLEINTLKIEFNSLTPEQKTFLKGADGKSLTFDMLTPEQKQELKGADGKSLTFAMLTSEQKQELKGADGKSLTFDILTPEQKEELKGADGKSLTYDDLTPEQKEELKGADGKSLTYDDLTPEQKEELKGADGKSLTYNDLTLEQKQELKGADGKSLTYDDLTLEQKQELKGANGLSAYEVALNNGFEGSETQWLDSLKGSSSSGGGSSLALPITITDVEDLQEWMTSYQKSVSNLQQSLNAGIIGDVNINQLNGNFNSLNGKIESVMGALFGIEKEDDETGLLITVQEGLFEKFEKLYNQVNPPVGG